MPRQNFPSLIRRRRIHLSWDAYAAWTAFSFLFFFFGPYHSLLKYERPTELPGEEVEILLMEYRYLLQGAARICSRSRLTACKAAAEDGAGLMVRNGNREEHVTTGERRRTRRPCVLPKI